MARRHTVTYWAGARGVAANTEDAGLMTPLTDFILRTACRQLRQWQSRDACFDDLDMM